MNKVILIGRLTKDPELQTVGEDLSLCKFGLAVNRRFKKDGDQEADFFNISVWRQQAINCEKYLNKGSQVAVSGRIEIQNYEDKDGNKRNYTNIVADEVMFLGSNGDSNSSSSNQSTATKSGSKPNADVDDLPF